MATVDELLGFYDIPIQELINKASKVTAENFNDDVEFCSIISARTGKCTENCKYCAQSSHYRTNIDTHPLVAIEAVKKCAISARENGVSRFSLVTSGKAPSNDDFDELLKMVEGINSIDGLDACASLGILNEKMIKSLKVSKKQSIYFLLSYNPPNIKYFFNDFYNNINIKIIRFI